MDDDLFGKAVNFSIALVILLAVVVLGYLVVSLITGHPIDPHPPTIISICHGKGC